MAVLIQRGGPDALDLATRQGGLEHVAGVEAAAGTTGPNDGMDLVDEEDHIRAVLQLVHHRLHALLELAAVFGAGHQAGDVQGHDALVEEHAAHLALNDAQGEAFGDGALAHAGFADQHGVVLLTAGEDLAHALDLLLAAHDRVQLAVLGQLGEVAAEVVQDRCLALAVALLPLTCPAAGEGAAVVVVVIGTLRTLCPRLAGVCGAGRRPICEDHVQLVLHGLVVHMELPQGARSQVVLVLEDAQQQMLRIDVRTLEELGFEVGDLQHLLHLLQQLDALLVGGAGRTGGLHAALHGPPQLIEVDLEALQDAQGVAFHMPQQPEQDVLDTDEVVPEAQGLFTAVADDIPDTGGEFGVHAVWSQSWGLSKPCPTRCDGAQVKR